MKCIKIVLTLMLSLLMLISAGCGKSAGQVPAKEKAMRIVSLNLDSDEILLDLVPPDRIAALSTMADSPSDYAADKAKAVPVHMTDNSAEEIIRLHPDLVISADWLDSDLRNTLTDMGIRVYSYHFASTLDEVPSVIRGIAAATGDEKSGEKMVSKYTSDLSRLKTEIAKDQPEPSVFLWAYSQPYGSGDSIFGDMCRFIGVKNVLDKFDAREAGVLDKEFLISVNPDCILVSDIALTPSHVQDLKNVFLSDPSLSTLKAVRSGNIVPISPAAIYCPSQYAIKGIKELYQAVYGRPLEE